MEKDIYAFQMILLQYVKQDKNTLFSCRQAFLMPLRICAQLNAYIYDFLFHAISRKHSLIKAWLVHPQTSFGLDLLFAGLFYTDTRRHLFCCLTLQGHHQVGQAAAN